MRILLVNHGSAGEWGGGDAVQIRETGKRLKQRGHEVVGINSDQPTAVVLTWYTCSTAESRAFHQQMASCRAAGVPIVVSPIWISLARAIWEAAAAPAYSARQLNKERPLLNPFLNNCAGGSWW